MNLKIYFKEKDNYVIKEIESPKETNLDFFRKLKIQLEIQQQNIKEDLMKLANDNNSGYLMRPLSNDDKKQRIINELVKFRKINGDTLNRIKSMLCEDDFIVCENCKGIMHKLPLGINYERIGNTIIIKEEKLKQKIEYIYACDKCPFAIPEEIYMQKVNKTI